MNNTQGEQLTVNDQYKKLVINTTKTVQDLNRSVIRGYHSIGKQASRLKEKPEYYGSRGVDQFAKDMTAYGGVQLGKDAIYDAISIYAYITPEQLKQAETGNISLRNLLALTVKRVTPEMRQQILDEVTAGNTEQTKIKDAVDMMSGGAGGDNPPDNGADDDAKNIIMLTKQLKGMIQIVLGAHKKVEGYSNHVDTICKGGLENKMKESYAVYDELCATVDTFTKSFDREMVKADESFKTVMSVINPD